MLLSNSCLYFAFKINLINVQYVEFPLENFHLQNTPTIIQSSEVPAKS